MTSFAFPQPGERRNPRAVPISEDDLLQAAINAETVWRLAIRVAHDPDECRRLAAHADRLIDLFTPEQWERFRTFLVSIPPDALGLVR